MDLSFDAVAKDEGGPLGAKRAEAGSKPRSAAAIQKVVVVNDCVKADRKGLQVRVEKRNASEPSKTHRKVSSDAVKTAGGQISRDKLGERSADRPSGSRCGGGLSSTHGL